MDPKDKFDKDILEKTIIKLEAEKNQLHKDLQEALKIWDKYKVIEEENKDFKIANAELLKYKSLLEEKDSEIKKYESLANSFKSLDSNLKKIMDRLVNEPLKHSVGNKQVTEIDDERLQDEIYDLHKENKELKKENAELKKLIEALHSKNAKLEGQITIYKDIQVDIFEYKSKIKILTDENQELKKNKENSINNWVNMYKELDKENQKLKDEAKDYLPFNNLYDTYNKLSDDVKFSLKTVFGDGASKFSILVNMTKNFSDFWLFLFDRVNNDLLPESELENLKHLFDISFEIMRSYDSKFERLETKEGDVFDPSIMNKYKLATKVDKVNKVLLLGYKRASSIKSSLVR